MAIHATSLKKNVFRINRKKYINGVGLVTKSCPTLATAWTVAHQAPLSNFPGKNTAVGCHFLLPGNLPDPGIKLRSPALQVDSSPTELPPTSYP